MSLNSYYYSVRNNRKAVVQIKDQSSEKFDFIDNQGFKCIETENIHSHWSNGFLNWSEDLMTVATELSGDAGLHSKELPLTCNANGKKYRYAFTDWLDKGNGIGSHWYKEE